MLRQRAYFAGGCFWCITPTFREREGVTNVTSGYCGGDEQDPSYADVKNQKTGHRETVRVDFDADTVSFGELLDMFLASVDPFDGGGQFIDRGHSYTLAVYATDETQFETAKERLRQLEASCSRPAFVAVEPYKCFYSAEEEHQDYDLKNPEAFHRELIESGRIKP